MNVTIRNRASIEQWIVLDGKREIIGPYQSRHVTEEVAEAFVRQCPNWVSRAQAVGGVDENSVQRTPASMRYIYNATGNPDVPATVTIQRNSRLGVTTVEIPNPLREPIILRRERRGGDVPGQELGSGLATTFKSAPVVIELWPYTRKLLNKADADWFLSREGNQEVGHSGKAKIAREPSSFEPDESWELEDLRMYAYLIDSRMDKGPTYDMVKRSGKKDADSLVEKLRQAKDLLLRRLFFRYVDPRFRLPARIEFEDYKARCEASSLPDATEDVTSAVGA